MNQCIAPLSGMAKVNDFWPGVNCQANFCLPKSAIKTILWTFLTKKMLNIWKNVA